MESSQTSSGESQFDSGCILEQAGVNWDGPNKRRMRRFQVAGSRPVFLRSAEAGDEGEGQWLVADILDMSLGGLCLLIADSLDLKPEQRVELDLRPHPQFPWLRVTVEVRWWINAGSFTTLGVVVPAPLETIPRLEQERRGSRRDPNLEA